MKRKNNHLDLHGVQHSEVVIHLENFFFLGNNYQGTIITGNSKEMKQIVLDWLEEHDFHFYVPTDNTGRIEVQDNFF